jgi:ABC-type polysaccharide/polyol phosphate export permease
MKKNIQHDTIRHLLQYRDLFYIFVWKDFSVKYRQTVLGIVWAIIQPFSFMLLFTFIFTYVMPVKVSSFPYAVFFYAGLLPWAFFSSTINYSIQSFTGNNHLLRQTYFPRIILPLTGVFTAFVDFLIAAVFLMGLLAFYKIPVSVTALWYIPLFFLLFLFSLSLALILSVLNVYYQDVSLISPFFIQLLFFMTPVFYSIDNLPLRLKTVVFLNPLTFIIENMKRCLFEQRPVVGWQYTVMLLGLSAFLFLSYQFFKSMERKLSDVL